MNVWHLGAIGVIVLSILAELSVGRTYPAPGMAFISALFIFGVLLLALWLKLKWHHAKWKL